MTVNKKAQTTATDGFPPSFKLRHTLYGQGWMNHRLAWSPDGKLIAAACSDQTVKIWNVSSGVLLHELMGQKGSVFAVAFSPDNSLIASAGEDCDVWLWRTNDGQCLHRLEGHRADIWDVVFSPDGNFLASASDDFTVGLWKLSDYTCDGFLTAHNNEVWGVAFSQDGTLIASGSADTLVCIWRVSDRSCLNRLVGHDNSVFTLAFSPNDSLIASASVDGTIRIWDRTTRQQLSILEGHQNSVEVVSFSADGGLLASKSLDGTVRLWNCNSWDTIAILEESMQERWHPGLAFHPTEPVLATLGELDTAVRIWDLEKEVLLSMCNVDRTTHYTNAKVVLLGNSSTGKTCLARVLMGLPFAPQESTHGLGVWNFQEETVTIDEGSRTWENDSQTKRREAQGEIIRETLLWDLAGQVDYQLIHQLYLDQTALGIVMFDPVHPENPFTGVELWEKTLKRVAGEDCPRLLVAGRVDRGYPTVTENDIAAFCQQHGYQQFIATSAKTGQGVEELRKAIQQAIPWERLPVTSSPELWTRIREYLLVRRIDDEVLTSCTDLRNVFRVKHSDVKFTEDEFDIVIGHAQVQGILWRLSFGDFVLLKPELMNNYAAAIVRAARQQSEGLGCVAEQDVLEAKIDFEDLERIAVAETERSLLHAVIQLLLEREVALRESGQLAFPSKINRQRPDVPKPQLREVAYRFAGSVEAIYATLVVRLFYCGAFTLKALWKNGVDFNDALDTLCGLTLDNSSEGQGVISVFFAADSSNSSKVLFLRFIHEHLHQRSLTDSVQRERIYRCRKCGEEVQNQRAVRVRLSRGEKSIRCLFCDDVNIDLVDVLETKFGDPELLRQIRELEAEVVDKKSQVVGVTVADAKKSVDEYDVFLAHNSADKAQVEVIAQALRRRSLNPWLDKEQIPPGHWFQDVIQQAIRDVKSAAIFIGTQGLGRWQIVELRSFISQCVNRNIPVIPVLLPGVIEIPTGLVFLKEFNWVEFSYDIDDAAALDNLEWGITGEHPKKTQRGQIEKKGDRHVDLL